MALSSLEIKWTSQVLTLLVTDSAQRIKRGAELRKHMMDEIEAGKRPTGYRPDWIRDCARRILAELGEMGNEFNNNHHADQASSEDLMDVLATAMELLRTKGKVRSTQALPKPEA